MFWARMFWENGVNSTESCKKSLSLIRLSHPGYRQSKTTGGGMLRRLPLRIQAATLNITNNKKKCSFSLIPFYVVVWRFKDDTERKTYLLMSVTVCICTQKFLFNYASDDYDDFFQIFCHFVTLENLKAYCYNIAADVHTNYIVCTTSSDFYNSNPPSQLTRLESSDRMFPSSITILNSCIYLLK